jgi:hypothetical protein
MIRRDKSGVDFYVVLNCVAVLTGATDSVHMNFLVYNVQRRQMTYFT